MEEKHMKEGGFYERAEVIHEVVESERSRICYELITRLLAKENGSTRRKRILDIGCGDGSFIVRFKELYEVFGVDVSSEAVKLAERAGVNARKSDASSEKLPFGSDYFDLVYMGDVIEHLFNPDFAIKETARVMRPEGLLLLSTPNLASWLNRLLLLLGFQPLSTEVSTVKDFGRPGVQSRLKSMPVGHLRLFTLRALGEFLIYHGFDVIKVRGTTLEMHSKTLKAVDSILSKVPSLASIIIMVACRNR